LAQVQFQRILPQKSDFNLKNLGIDAIRRYCSAEFYHLSTTPSSNEMAILEG
jgi:hypothetical protein